MIFSQKIRIIAFCVGAATVMSWAAGPVGAATFAAAMPTVTPIPITAESYPWLYYKYVQRPLELDKAGYVEEEYLVSGTANVYDWDADPNKDLIVKQRNAPYATRILVRRPADPAKFSGTVVVETMNPARGFDMAIMFGWIGPHLIERGDAWIGVSVSANVMPSLKRFDPARYSKVSFANPLPEGQRACPAPASGGRGNASSNANENGLRLDALAQIGTWLKSGDAGNPLAGRVRNTFLIGHTGGDIATYVNSVGHQARLANGNAIYDGYIAHSGSNAGTLMNCGHALAEGDPRIIPGRAGVPVIVMKTQTDLPYVGRPDSDAPNDVFRVYDLPAAAHADWYLFRYLPLVEQQARASDRIPVTDVWAFDSNCSIPDQQISRYPQGYIIGGALENLERYARDRTPLPKASRVPTITRGNQEVQLQMDAYGNAVGGVRSPYIDVPTGTYNAKLTGANGTCGSMVNVETWPWYKTMALYGSYDNYRQKVEASLEKMLAERWVTPSDAERIRKDLIPASN